MHEKIKQKLGIKKCDCSTCANMYFEDDGNYAEYAISWPSCSKRESFQYLKSFPFKKEKECYEPDFWHSKFTKMIDGSDKSVYAAMDKFLEEKNKIC